MFCIHIYFNNIEIAFFLILFCFVFFLCVCVCVYVCLAFLLTCMLFLFNTDVNWLPGSASPYGYSRQLVLKLLLLIFSLKLYFFFLFFSKNEYKERLIDLKVDVCFFPWKGIGRYNVNICKVG